MEKTNTQIVYDLLTEKPMKSGEIEETTSIPKTTLFRILNTMVDDKLIYKKSGFYKAYRKCPTIAQIYEKMEMFHQQRLMDHTYRKMNSKERLDLVTNWFIFSPLTIKGQIEDYNFDELINNITKASLQLPL